MAYIETEIRDSGPDINPKLWLLQTAEDWQHNSEMLGLAYFPEEGWVAVGGYTLEDPVAVHFRSHGVDLNCIDAIAESYNVTRSEVIRHALRAFISGFEGEFREGQIQLELQERGEGAEPLRTAQAKRQKTPGHRPASLELAKHTLMGVA